MTSCFWSAAANIIEVSAHRGQEPEYEKSPASWNKLSIAGEADESTVGDNNVVKHPAQDSTRWDSNIE